MAILGTKNTLTIKEARSIYFDLKQELGLIKGTLSFNNSFTDKEILIYVVPLLTGMDHQEASSHLKSNNVLIEKLIEKIQQVTVNRYLTDKEKEALYLDIRKKYNQLLSDKAKDFTKAFKPNVSDALKRIQLTIDTLKEVYDNSYLKILNSVFLKLQYINNDFKNREQNIFFNGRFTEVADVLDTLLPLFPELSARDESYYNKRFVYNNSKYYEALSSYLKAKRLPVKYIYIDTEAEKAGETPTAYRAKIIEQWLEDNQRQTTQLEYAKSKINEIANGSNFETLEEYKKKFKDSLLGND